MRFGNPQLFWLVGLLILLLGLIAHGAVKNGRLLRQAWKPQNLRALLPQYSRRHRLIKLACSYMGLVLLFIATLSPQWGFRWVVEPKRAVDLMIVVDVSQSMLATDLKPNRLERVRRKLHDLLPMLTGERIGLIAFAGASHVLCPLTDDYDAVGLFLDYLDTDLIPIQGTNLGAALKKAVESFETGTTNSRQLFLITDGEDLGEEAKIAAELAKREGVRISVLGIGSPEGAPLADEGGSGGFRKDQKGNVILSKLDEPLLQELAQISGGKYARSVADDADLIALYREGIANLTSSGEKPNSKDQRREVYTERYQLFLFPAMLLFILSFMLPDRQRPALAQPSPKAVALRAVMALAVISGLLLTANPLFAGPMSNGVKSYNQNDFDSALQHFASAQVDHPDKAELHYNTANSYYRLNRFPEAAAEYEKALKSAPTGKPEFQQKTHFNLGNAQFRNQAFQQAIDQYNQALKLDPTDEEAKHNLELAKKMLEQQKQQKDSPDQKDKDDKSQTKNDSAQPPEPQSNQNHNADPAQPPTQSNEPPRKMSEAEAKQWLSTIEENGKQALKQSLQQKMAKQPKPDKDW